MPDDPAGRALSVTVRILCATVRVAGCAMGILALASSSALAAESLQGAADTSRANPETPTLPPGVPPLNSAASPTPGAAEAVPPANENPVSGWPVDPRRWMWVKNLSLTDPDTWPFIPIPEIVTDPNGGTTGGLLTAVLFTDKNRQITGILAPDIESNTTLGYGGTFRYLAYPSEDTQWYVIAGAQRYIARKVDFDFQTGREKNASLSLEGRFYFEKDPTERFFGVGNDTPFGDQTNYTTKQVYGLGVLGINVTDRLQLAYLFRPRQVRIEPGAFNLPSIFQRFPTQKGINGGSEVLNQVTLTYDTRDSLEIPRQGRLGVLFFDLVDRALGSTSSYTRFGGDLHQYYPVGARVTLAGHVFVQYTPAGNETPFWAMARLGGESSLLIDQQTLRGFGAGRYVDNNLAVLNAEVRTRVWEHDLFGTHGMLELAPFLDIGRVGHTLGYNPFEQLHAAGGAGFRGIALPFVVAYLDVGYGGEGVAVFSGINYPF